MNVQADGSMEVYFTFFLLLCLAFFHDEKFSEVIREKKEITLG